MRSSRLPTGTAFLLVTLILTGCSAASPSSPRPSVVSSDPVAASSPSPTPSRSPAPPPATPAPTVEPTGLGLTPGTWHPTGNLRGPRAYHTATRLSDGRVLVAGGIVNDQLDGQTVASAELYDPRSGRWSPTGSLSVARRGHSATLLPDGTVLVAGGYLGEGYLDTAERYDPGTGRWTATGRMTVGRGGHTATLMADGRVLVIGGGGENDDNEGGPRSATAEVYDPGTGRWTSTGSMSQARKGFKATLLSDGTVLVAGDDDSAERYDPRTGAWAATGSLTEARWGYTATLLTDGTVLVAGGCNCGEPGAVMTAEIYDPVLGTWSAVGSMSHPRIGHTDALLADGSVLVANGFDRDDPSPSAERYDPIRQRWIAAAAPSSKRPGSSMTLLADGRALLVGDYDNLAEGTAEIYEP